MDYSKGFAAYYEAFRVDPVTWTDEEELLLTDGRLTRNTDSLRESASVTMTDMPAGEFWIRIYLKAAQEGTQDRRAIFTGLATSPEKSIDDGFISYSVDCYSALKPAADVFVPVGYYAPSGISAAEIAADLLGSVTPAPVEVAARSPALTSAIVAEDEETDLTMAEKIIDAIGWRIRTAGDGTVVIEPASTEEKRTFGASNDVLEMSVTDKQDLFSVPNVLRVVVGSTVTVARDEDPDSPYSVSNRGREVWAQEKNPTIPDDTSVTQFAREQLKTKQAAARTVSYTRRFDPDIFVGDIVRLNYSEIQGLFRITSQSIDLSAGAPVQEEAEYIG
ncbi:MAG: hypothetical protein ACOYJH_03010 [Anaerovoracaceae bacterium]|jgi:hypothetical protein